MIYRRPYEVDKMSFVIALHRGSCLCQENKCVYRKRRMTVRKGEYNLVNTEKLLIDISKLMDLL